MDLTKLLTGVIIQLNGDWNNPDLVQIESDTNLFELLDSFSVLSIVIESESVIEENFGDYIPLADEILMDSNKSPFIKFSSWVSFVQNKIEQAKNG